MSKKDGKHENQAEANEELDYILQALGHQVRRKVIEILAEEGSQTYTELMRKTGVDDSGTFGFHLRRMQKLLKKNQRGEYELSELGWKAYKILKQLKGEKPVEKVEEKIEKKEAVEKLTPLIISDRMNFELTKEMAKAYLQRGRKLVITDILKVVIYPMSRELFDKVVESISDVLTLYAPKTLEDLIHEKAKDVTTIKFYTDKPPRIGIDLGGMITGLVSSIVSGVTGLVSGLTSSLVGKTLVSLGKGRLELTSDEPLPTKNIKKITAEVNGGIIELKEGAEPRLRIWKPKDGKTMINVNIGEDNIDVELESGKIELTLPENKIRELELNMNGGYASISLQGVEYMKADINGGWMKSKITTSSENPQMIISVNGGGGEVTLNTKKPPKETNIELELNGGVLKLAVNTCKQTKIKTSSEIEGGIISVKLDYKDIPPNYTEQGYEDAESKLTIRTEILGGVASISINR